MRIQHGGVVLITAVLLAFSVPSCRRRDHPRTSQLSMAADTLPPERATGLYGKAQGWRWTKRIFAFALDVPKTDKAIYLNLEFAVPDELMEANRTVTLIATVNGLEAGRQRYTKPGLVHLTRYVPQSALTRNPASVNFELDHSVTDASTGNEHGLIALSVGLMEYEETAEYRDAQNWLAEQDAKKVMKQTAEQFPPAKVIELRKLFFSLPALNKLDFQGVPIDRNPLDLWNMQQIAYEVRPRFVIDTGAGDGGAALYWAHTLHGIGAEDSKIIAIDRQDRTGKASQHLLWRRYVEFMPGDLTDPALLTRLKDRAKDGAVLVVLDAGQEAASVLAAIRAYAPLVTRGSYLAVENTAMDSDPAGRLEGAGAAEGVRRFLAEGGGQDFEVDSARDMFVLTSSPGGWLRRK